MPSDEEIGAFLEGHPEPLVTIPPESMSAFQEGARAVLMLSPEAIPPRDEPVWEIIGFADDGNKALRMLHEVIADLRSVTMRDVFYYGPHLWPPVSGKAFMPAIP